MIRVISLADSKEDIDYILNIASTQEKFEMNTAHIEYGLKEFISLGNPDYVELLLPYVQDSSTAICLTAIKGCDDILKILMTHGKYTKDSIEMALFEAAGRGHISCVKHITTVEKSFLDINSGYDYALLNACVENHYDTASYLLSCGAKNIKECKYEAKFAKNYRIVELLNSYNL